MSAKTRQILFVTQRAMRGYDELPPADRITLLCGLAEILPGEVAEAARHAAFCLQTSEEKQMQFRALLDQPKQ